MTTATATAQAPHAINTKALAGQYKQFQFWRIPEFVRDNERLTSTAKYLYGEFNFKAGEKGYIDKCRRDQLATEAKLSLPAYNRALAELTREKLVMSLPCGNGKPNVYVLLAHPDMQLPPEELNRRQIRLPRRVQIRIDRATRRAVQRTSAVSDVRPQTPSAVSNVRRLFKDLNIPLEDTMALASPWPATIITITVVKTQQPATPAAFTQPAAIDPIAPVTPAVSLPAPASTLLATPVNTSVATPVLAPAPAPAEKKIKKGKARKPRSKHSLELCLRFAQVEQERKGTIEDAQQFGEACYWTGWHDKEIDRWLRRRATAEVGKYQPNKQTDKTAPDAPPQSQPTTAAPATATASDAERKALQYAQELSERRLAAFNQLSAAQQQALVNAKHAQLQDSVFWPKLKRMPPPRLLEHIINQIQNDLVTD